MNPGTTGVSASNPSVPVRRRGPRGVQLEAVVEAADALLARGLETHHRARSSAPRGRLAQHREPLTGRLV